MSENTAATSNFPDGLLTPLATNNGVGEWLRYDPLYGRIRDARREDDDGMHREPWEGELKHANWQEVERLCIDAITTKSKDLQLLLWFLEARIHLYGVSDLPNSSDLLLKFIQTFWENIYPQKTDDPSQEFRTHLLESFLRSACEQVVLEPIVELSQFFNQPPNLAKCYEADNLEKSSKRGDQAAEFFQKSIAKGLITMDRVRNALHEVNKEKGTVKVNLIEASIKNLTDIETILTQEIGNEAPRFDELISNLSELKGLYNLCQKVAEAKIIAPSPGPGLSTPEIKSETSTDHKDSQVINDRAGVYQALRQLGDFLITLEPHSPSPALISLIGTWENKTFSQILADLQTSPTDVRSLLNLLARATSSENQQVNLSNQPLGQQPSTSNDLSQLSNLARD